MTVGHDASQPRWYYDFLSPFTYLLLEQQDKWPSMPFEPVPVSLPVLQHHWGQRPMYDVPAKRVFTYRHALFRADQLGIPFRMPPAHPFDSTQVLRLAVAISADLATVREMFRFIWREGRDPTSEEGFAALCERVGVTPDDPRLDSAQTSEQLERNTRDAIALGVFGVPTFWMNRQLFWGEDALPMVLYCARTPNWLESKEVKRISTLPPGRR